MPTKKLVSLNSGLISKYNPQKAGEFKVLQDIDQDAEIGSIESRKGFSTDKFFQNDAVGTDYPGAIQGWKLKNNNVLLRNAKRINGENGSILYVEKNDKSVEAVLNHDNLLIEPYGMKCVTFQDTFIAFLGTLIGSGGSDIDKNELSVFSSEQIKKTLTSAPEKEDIFFSYGDEIGAPSGRVSVGSCYHRYMYQFIFSDGTKSDFTKSNDCYYANSVGNIAPNCSANSIVLHLSRNVVNFAQAYLTVSEIKIYRNSFVGSIKPDLTIFDAKPYQFIGSISGAQLDLRETGDTLEDNYVKYVDDKTFFGDKLLVPYLNLNSDVYLENLFLRYYSSDMIDVNTTGSILYVPKPCYIEAFNNRLMALGDPLYPRYLFFSKDAYTDFYADNSTELPFPTGDTHGTAMVALGDNLYCFSENSTIRVTETSTELPYYRIEPVEGMQGIGCIAPNTIIKAFGKVYFLSREGFIEFNGVSFKILSTPIDDVIKSLDFKYYSQATGLEVENPMKQPSFYKPFLAQAIYNPQDTCIYLMLPLTVTVSQFDDVYVPISRETTIYKYNLKLNKWSTLNISWGGVASFVKSLGNETEVAYFNQLSELEKMTENKYDDTERQGFVVTNIPCTLENNDVDLGENVFIKSITITGTGNVNIYIYKDKSDTAKVTKLNKKLNETRGAEIVLNITARFLRVKIVSVDSVNFKLTDDIYITAVNTGHKTKEVI